MTNWNYADVWETVADIQPDAAPHPGRPPLTWAEFDRGADGIAQFLLDLGVARQDKVAVYLYNCPEYLQITFAAFKVGLVPVNTNYRYGDDELSYLWDNADAVAVVFHGTFADGSKGSSTGAQVKGWLWVDDGSGPCPDWATPYDDAVKSARRVRAPWGRSGDDLFMLYTGGTTGMPKGVMWRQDDLFARLIVGGVRRYPSTAGSTTCARRSGQPGLRHLMPACPLMHGTGGFTANTMLAEGGRICLLSRIRPGRTARTVGGRRSTVWSSWRPFSRPLLTRSTTTPAAGT